MPRRPRPARRPPGAAGSSAGSCWRWWPCCSPRRSSAGTRSSRRCPRCLPPLLTVYQRLGLPVTLHEGLEFADLASARRGPRGTQAVTVSGQVRNTTDHELPVPKLRVALLDDRHHELRSKLFDPSQATLPPGGTMRFDLELPDPPAEARDFTIAFGDQP